MQRTAYPMGLGTLDGLPELVSNLRRENAMFTMPTHPSDTNDARNAVTACVVACFVLLACLIVVDKLFGPDLADQIHRERVYAG